MTLMARLASQKEELNSSPKQVRSSLKKLRYYTTVLMHLLLLVHSHTSITNHSYPKTKKKIYQISF